MYRQVELDRTGLGELATGEGFDGPAAYVARMEEAGTHNEGGTIASINKLQVRGDRAVVSGCLRSSMLEMNEAKVPAELPEVFVRTREVLVREGPDWRVAEATVLGVGKACTYR